jgi:hypothetical protein
MTQEKWESPDILWCANVDGAEYHFDEGTYKELLHWLDEVGVAINESGDKHRFARFHTENIYGEELTFSYLSVGATFISTPETRRKSRIGGEARKQERIEQGFRRDDE